MEDLVLVLDRARSAGLRVWAEGNEVLAEGRRTPEALAVVETLRQQKPRVLAYLRSRERKGTSEASLLAWAGELAERDTILPSPVTYVEAPLRSITTERVSYYAAYYLKTIVWARSQQENPGWGIFTPDWWRQREIEALGALAALREALSGRERKEQ